jgi:tRNA pseudouridine55 synthase
MDGFLVIDKPKGLTSHDVVARLRDKLHESKIGHTGTLDPIATGVLVLGLGKATRLLEYLAGLDKTYLATITLGGESTTYDAEGDIEDVDVPKENQPKEEDVVDALQKFRGEIYQTPPTFSAIKIDGERSYKLARKGTPKTPPIRKVKIHSIELHEYSYPHVTICIECASGTYIRSIAHDLGIALKTGGYMSALKREKVGPFALEQAAELAQIDVSNVDRYIQPLHVAQGLHPGIALTQPDLLRIKKGQSVKTHRTYTSKTPVFAYFQNELISIMEYDVMKQRLRPKKVLC